jgi:hypothetical protein
MRAHVRNVAEVISTVPPQVPMLEDDDLPCEEDWAVLEALRVEADWADDPGDVSALHAFCRGAPWTGDLVES